MAYEGDIMYFSYRDTPYLGSNIVSRVRSQDLVSASSCPQHAAGAVLEMLTWMKHLREGRGHERKEICIPKMYERYKNYRRSMGMKEESSTKELLLWLKANVVFSKDGSEAFELNDFKELNPLDKVQCIAQMLRYLFKDGPFVGVYYIRYDFDRGGKTEIYLCEDVIFYYGHKRKPVRHAVVVVGFGIDRNLNPFWEYLESCTPHQSTYRGDGFGRVIITGFDKAYLLYV